MPKPESEMTTATLSASQRAGDGLIGSVISRESPHLRNVSSDAEFPLALRLVIARRP